MNRRSASEIDLIDRITGDLYLVIVEIQEIGHVHDLHVVTIVKGKYSPPIEF